MPALEKQLWFDEIHRNVSELLALEADSAAELNAILPAILDKAFKGEL